MPLSTWRDWPAVRCLRSFLAPRRKHMEEGVLRELLQEDFPMGSYRVSDEERPHSAALVIRVGVKRLVTRITTPSADASSTTRSRQFTGVRVWAQLARRYVSVDLPVTVSTAEVYAAMNAVVTLIQNGGLDWWRAEYYVPFENRYPVVQLTVTGQKMSLRVFQLWLFFCTMQKIPLEEALNRYWFGNWPSNQDWANTDEDDGWYGVQLSPLRPKFWSTTLAVRGAQEGTRRTRLYDFRLPEVSW